MKQHRTLKVGNETRLIGIWEKLTGVKSRTIRYRIKMKRTPEQCIGREPIPKRVKKPRKKSGRPRGGQPGPRQRTNRLGKFDALYPVSKVVIEVDHEAMGEIARRIRVLSGRSLQQASESLGISAAQLASLERGTTQWKTKTIDHFNKVAKGWVK